MRLRLLLGFCFLLSCFESLAHAAPVAVTPAGLTVEFRSNPVGVGTARPVFGWVLAVNSVAARGVRQSGYRIELATTPAGWSHAPNLLWDSGRVASTTFWQRPYEGPALASHTTYYWRAQVWIRGASPGPWSKPARFTTALLSENDWTAHWIAAEPDRGPSVQALEGGGPKLSSLPPPLPVFRGEFSLNKPVQSALLYVAGLGQYEIHLNGKNVTETVLNSGWTNYRKTVLYNTYDVTGLLRPQGNAFGVLLGNGMYNVEDVKGHYTKFAGSFGQPKCRVQLEVRYTDGSTARIGSDATWRTHAGPLLYSSTYGGETFDAGALPADWDLRGFQAKGWAPAIEVEGPGGKMAADPSSPLIVAESYPAVHTSSPKPEVTVYDFGVNMSGWPRVAVRGQAGSRLHLLAGELLNPDGTVTQRSAAATPKDPVEFNYILAGLGVEQWNPRFTYYSFRYVQVTTDAAATGGELPRIISMTGDFVHARVETVGNFRSSDELFNRIHGLIDRAVLSNLASVVTDCPSREKLGWLEQTYLNASTLMLNYDVTALYEKMSEDIADAQLANGLVPGIAPEYVAFVDSKGQSTKFRDSPEWGSAVILSPWALYEWTGDDRPLRANYLRMQRYAAYLQSRSQGGILDYGLGDWYDVGPREPGESQLTSRAVTATGVLYEDLTVLARVASLLGHPEDAAAYSRQAAAVRAAYNTRLFHPDTEEYDRGSQTANAFPLALGMVPLEHVAGVLANLVKDIRAHGDHVTAGDVGFHYVVRALTDAGRSDVLAAMLSRTDSPSYGYQLGRGATTLTEAWDTNPKSSQNHFMLGHGEEWFYRGLAGLTVDMARGAEDAIDLQPTMVVGVDAASASYRSPMGQVSIAWTHTARRATVQVTVPAGAQAHLTLPRGSGWQWTGDLSHGESSITGAAPIVLESGVYRFSADTP